ncbi:MAG: hypothetical protein CL910_18250 [Deltaproteobacteria bacterium]|jgi:hypothetical protein|nr:hypothetical protein [Deltaproteobacteria bacterium]
MPRATSILVCLLLLASLLGSAGCHSPTRTVTITETIECEAPDAEGERDCRTVSRETRTEKPDREHHGCDGIVSCGFGAVGEVIALPFRILGVVLDVIF